MTDQADATVGLVRAEMAKGLRMEQGIVTSVSPIMARVGRSTVAVQLPSTVGVAVGDQVVVHGQGADRVITGVIGAPEIRAVRRFTSGAMAIANGAVSQILFAAISGQEQVTSAEPGFANPGFGECVFDVAGLYLFDLVLTFSATFTPIESGIAIYNGAINVGAQPLHGAFARSAHTFTFTQMPGAAAASIGFRVFNNAGVTLNVASFAMVATRLTRFTF